MLKTYCVNLNCPFKDCKKHLGKSKGKWVKVSNFDSVCERYLKYVLEDLERGGDNA